jgi:hypothetical protein
MIEATTNARFVMLLWVMLLWVMAASPYRVGTGTIAGSRLRFPHCFRQLRIRRLWVFAGSHPLPTGP